MHCKYQLTGSASCFHSRNYRSRQAQLLPALNEFCRSLLPCSPKLNGTAGKKNRTGTSTMLVGKHSSELKVKVASAGICGYSNQTTSACTLPALLVHVPYPKATWNTVAASLAVTAYNPIGNLATISDTHFAGSMSEGIFANFIAATLSYALDAMNFWL